ncbi:MAG TPA: CDGSH iron-sulfur domain-containing protein [Alphaproteobacteria bacterium]|nr:CDGSH iron-sulfur domain-containing protein [Alphaproteobacteria bacterium]
MDKPVATQNEPYGVEVEKGETYYWCACGLSKKQPFCDGSHSETDFKPIVFEAKESETVYLCGCRTTRDAPFCDGSHLSL